jgi:hypothetical protein
MMEDELELWNAEFPQWKLTQEELDFLNALFELGVEETAEAFEARFPRWMQ